MNKQISGKTSLHDINYRLIVLISLGTGILIHLPEIASLFSNHDLHTHYHPSWVLLNTTLDVSVSVLSSMITTFLLFVFHIRFFKKVKYNYWLIILAFVISFMIATGLSHLFSDLQVKLTGSRLLIDELHYLHPLQNLAVTLVVFLTCRIYFIANQRRQLNLEVQELKTENIQSQYEALKNQVNPHFLFNSLNTLNTLIRENPKTAQLYVNQLSKVLRSTMQSNQNNTVSLADELKDVEPYLFLLQMRYEGNFRVEKEIDNASLSLTIPPLALQHLIENAVKHNIISTQKPLLIKIYTTDHQTLVVSNTHQPKNGGVSDTGTGLANLSKRYLLLSGKDIEVSAGNDLFTVELPLLKNL